LNLIRHSSFVICHLFLAGSLLAAATTQPTPNTIEDNYQVVLSEMKHPPTTGILVTEIEPDSPAGPAGLQAGDIIYHYAGDTVRDLDSLRKKVADVFASELAENNDNKVLLGVHRAGNDVILQLPRAPLGIRAIEIDAGVPVTPNPPPSPRGSITLAWDDLARQQSTDSAQTFFRTSDSAGQWISWQRRTFAPAADAVTGEGDTYRVAPDTGAILSSEFASFRLRTGDYVSAPAFVLDSFDATIRTVNYSIITTHAERAGPTLRTQIKTAYADRVFTPIHSELETPLTAIPNAAVPLLAAALPQEKDAALSLHLLSVRDFLARPGYLLIARGKQPFPSTNNPADQVWRVDLLHCGVTIETYWFTDQRKLIEIDSISGTTLTTRHVGSLDEASLPVTPKPSTQPTTAPH